MIKQGWDMRLDPHYWRRHDGMLTTLCGNRSRPDRDDFELREGPLPYRFAKYCRECMRICEVDGLPCRQARPFEFEERKAA